MEKMNSNLEYWENRARSTQDPRAVTHYDTIQRQLEIDTITRLLDKRDTVLDVGCGNGFSTYYFSQYCQEITGIDFSPEMINRAKVENADSGKIKYLVADIRELKLNRRFSKVVSERCLINILDWEEQKQAISRIAGHLESGGYYIMVEGIADGRREINKIRLDLGMKPLSEVKFNLDFEKEKTEAFLKKYFSIEKMISFGLYELITRILYPLYIDPEEPTYGSKFHDIALKICQTLPDIIPQISKFGAWVLKKK